MEHALEFQGRLLRSDGRSVAAGRYDLRFDLRPTESSSASLWHEVVREVEVESGGGFSVILGLSSKLSAELFRSAPRFVSVRVSRGGKVGNEHGPRVPVTGTSLRNAGRLEQLERRLEEAGGILERDERIDKLPGRVSRLQRQLEELEARLTAFEAEGTADVLNGRLDEVVERLQALDGDDGRLRALQDELDDLVGPDGDVVDLNERMDRIEGSAPELIEALRVREQGPDEDDVVVLERGLEALKAEVGSLRGLLGEARAEAARGRTDVEVDPERIGAVKRSGDVMTGGLIINRGGLEVLSGGITSRGAEVTTLEARTLVKAPKVIADAVELRGELTVDSPHRAIQCRLLEGRQGSARKDGALHLNTRGGAEVVVGNAAEARGMEVHGPVRAGEAVFAGSTLGLVFEASGDPVPGDVMRVVAESGRAGRVSKDADPLVLGVAVEGAGILLGGPLSSGKVAVAVQGIVACHVDADLGAIAEGSLLVASERIGHARAIRDGEALPPGSLLGKALQSLPSGQGRVLVLLAVG